MTKVLHIYPKDDSLLANYVSQLCKASVGHADVCSTDDEGKAAELCQTFAPQIVHLHGSAKPPRKHSSRIVATPHGTGSVPAEAYACIARSDIEARQLAEAGIARIETIKNPIFTRSITFAEVAGRLSAVYAKVLISNALPLMTDDTRHMLGLLLKTALCGDRRWATPLPPPNSVEWPLLYSYAYAEGVAQLVAAGIAKQGLQAPSMTPPDCYLPTDYATPQPTKGPLDIATLLKKVKQQSTKGRLQLLTLCELFKALHQPTVNDEELLLALKADGQLPLFCATLQLLREQLLIDEGFMPCPPADNRTTTHLRNTLYQHLEL